MAARSQPIFLVMEDDAFSVLIQPDGKIVAVGSANDPATFYDFAAARYLSNGTIDTTFGVAGKVHTDFGDQNFDRARSAALQPDGRIVAAGFAISQNGGVQNFAVARYTSSGVLDTTFSTRREDANRLRQLLPECYQSPAAKRWQNHHRRRFERRVIRGRLFAGAFDSDAAHSIPLLVSAARCAPRLAISMAEPTGPLFSPMGRLWPSDCKPPSVINSATLPWRATLMASE